MVSARNSYDSCRRSAGYDDGYRAPEPRESLPPIRHDRAPIQRSPAKPTLRGRKTDKPPCRIILVSNTPAFCEWLASIGLSREDRPWSQTMVFLIPEMDTAQIADWVQVHWQSLFESWLTNWVPPESCPPMTYDEFRNFLMWKVPEGEFMLDIYLTGNL